MEKRKVTTKDRKEDQGANEESREGLCALSPDNDIYVRVAE